MKIFDGHNDTLQAAFGRSRRSGRRNFFERSEEGHIDLPRAREGGLAGGFFAIMAGGHPASSPAPDDLFGTPEAELPVPLDHDYALRVAMALAATLFRLEAQSDGQVAVVRDITELRRCLDTDVLAAVFHLEGAEPIDPDLHSLEVFYQAGLRSLGLVWSRANLFAEGVPFRFPSSPDTGPGLTEYGRRLVRRCNELGVMVDLSHLNERGFWDVAGLSTAPLVASHSNAHAVTPSPRNLTDAQLDAVRDSGGIVGVNFSVGFSRPDGGRETDLGLDVLVRHFDHLASRMGADHVGFGSDFDGTTVPDSLKDAAGLPRLVEALAAHGFSQAELEQMGTGNWLRVLDATWR